MKAKNKTKSHSKASHSLHKQSPHKPHPKKKKSKNHKPPPQDYIILNGNIYGANTHSERDKYSGFIHDYKHTSKFTYQAETHKLKKKSMDLKSSGYWSQKQVTSMEEETGEKQLDLEMYVKKLNKQQKVEMLRKLQKEVKINPENRELAERKNTEYLKTDKLSKLSEKLEKLKGQLLFKWRVQSELIDNQFRQKEITKHQRREKLYILDKMKEQKLKVIECTKVLFKKVLGSQSSRRNHQIEDILKSLSSLTSFDQLHLDCESSRYTDSQGSIKSQISFQKFSDEKEKIKIQQETCSPFSYSDSPEIDGFKCDEEPKPKKVSIPLLVSKQKTQQFQNERKMKEIIKAKEDLEKRLAFQMSELDQIQIYFTNLAGLNRYIVELYEFIIKTDLDRVLERFNIPYGKSVREKLYCLRSCGDVDQVQIIPVLEQNLFHKFSQQMTLKMRKFNEYEKSHHKAVFDCFNCHLNVYRPYFELEGEVYPWAISEKGMTFYQINQENIEQVFEKTKIRVLQCASFLCGLITNEYDHSIGKEMIKEKREQLQGKEEKIGLIEQYGKWGLKMVNIEALLKLFISQKIFQTEIIHISQEICRFSALN